MAFIVELEDGRELEFDKEPTSEDVEFAVNSLSQSSKPQQPQITDPQVLTQQKIQQRPDMFQLLGEGGLNAQFSPGVPASPGALPVLGAIGGVGQRAEAAIANPMLQAQQGNISPEDQFKSFQEGLSGKEFGEFGDVFRSIGVPEGASATLGVLSSIAFGNLASAGKIRSGEKAIRKSLERRSTQKSIEKNNKFFVNKANQLKKGVDDIGEGISKEFDDLYSKIGDNPIGANSLDELNLIQDTLSDLPPASVSSIKRQLGKNALKETPDTIGKAKKIRTALGKSIPEKVWNGSVDPTPQQINAMEAYFDLGDVIAKNAGDQAETLLKVNAKFKNFSKHKQSINKIILDPDGKIKTNQLKSIFSDGSQGKLQIIQDFAEQFDSATVDVLTDISKFNKSQARKKLAQQLFLGGARTGAAIGVGGAIGSKIGRRN